MLQNLLAKNDLLIRKRTSDNALRIKFIDSDTPGIMSKEAWLNDKLR